MFITIILIEFAIVSFGKIVLEQGLTHYTNINIFD